MLLFCCSSLCCFFRRGERLILTFNLRIRTSREGEGVIPRGLYLFIFGKGTKKWCGILPPAPRLPSPEDYRWVQFFWKRISTGREKTKQEYRGSQTTDILFYVDITKILEIWLSQSNIFFP